MTYLLTYIHSQSYNVSYLSWHLLTYFLQVMVFVYPYNLAWYISRNLCYYMFTQACCTVDPFWAVKSRKDVFLCSLFLYSTLFTIHTYISDIWPKSRSSYLNFVFAICIYLNDIYPSKNLNSTLLKTQQPIHQRLLINLIGRIFQFWILHSPKYLRTLVL